MSIHGSADTSCAISAIGNSGARSSGPIGSLGARVQRRLQRLGQIRAATLNHAVGIWSAARSNRVTHHLPLVRDRRGTPGRATERRRVVGAHERLADEHGVETGVGHPRRVVDGARIALSATATTSAGMQRREPLADAEVLGERREVAGVDADDAGARPRAPARPRPRRAPRRARRGRAPAASVVQVAQQRVVGQRGHDQQDGVGADRPGLVDLDRRRW